MSKISLLDVVGCALRWVREQAGWSRPRLSNKFRQERKFDGDFVSVKSMERYEALPVVPPHVVERYRDALGPEIFDDLLERSRALFPQIQQHGKGTGHSTIPRQRRAKSRNVVMRVPARRNSKTRTKRPGESTS